MKAIRGNIATDMEATGSTVNGDSDQDWRSDQTSANRSFSRRMEFWRGTGRREIVGSPPARTRIRSRLTTAGTPPVFLEQSVDLAWALPELGPPVHRGRARPELVSFRREANSRERLLRGRKHSVAFHLQLAVFRRHQNGRRLSRSILCLRVAIL